MRKRTPSAARFEVLLYTVALVFVYLAPVIPHILDYGWAWGWRWAGLGFPLMLLTYLVTLSIAAVAFVSVLARPKAPRAVFVLRALAVPILLAGPVIVSHAFGGLAACEGRGLADRLSQSTPLDALQSWAVEALEDGVSANRPLPAGVAQTLPPNPEVRVSDDHVTLWWYTNGVEVGAPGYQLENHGRYFFVQEVRPGIFAVVVEK